MISPSPKTGVSLCCLKCKEHKDTSRFARSGVNKTGFHCWCRDCMKLYHIERRARMESEDPIGFKKKRHAAGIRLKYGLTAEGYDRLLLMQDYKCAICEHPHSEDSMLLVDHIDLSDGKPYVRGLLCRCCNPGLGLFKEDPQLIRKALIYVEDALMEAYGIP